MSGKDQRVSEQYQQVIMKDQEGGEEDNKCMKEDHQRGAK
jgi:hypothetical protein